jgi:quinol monooxygenase YgiN
MSDTFTTALIVPRAPQNAEKIEALLVELAADAAREGGGLRTYAFFKGEDGTYRLIERYRDVAAELDHVVRNLDYDKVARLAELAEFRDLEKCGETSSELEEAIASFSPLYRRYLTGVI